jgi:hypothetical protein
MIANAVSAVHFRCGSIATEMRCPRYVRSSPIATKERTSWDVSNVPILLQKSQKAQRLIFRQRTKQATIADQ